MNKQSFYRKTTVVSLLMMLTISACMPRGEREHQYPRLGAFEKTGDYVINPEIILETLDKGESNVFLPMLATPDPNMQLLPSGSVPWTQPEYLRITNALSQLVWKEPIADWDVYYIAFKKECQDDPHGFDSLNAILYKTIEVNSQKIYTARQVEITPLAGQVSWGGGENFPRPLFGGWNNIDLAKSKITADEALQIAEEKGGREARLKVGNDCNILVSAPYDSHGSWHVGYYIRAAFEIIIDPYTGKYKILNTGQ